MRLPDLLNELTVSHGDGTLKKVIRAYQKIDLLILDEFLLSPVSTEQTRGLLEIIETQHKSLCYLLHPVRSQGLIKASRKGAAND